MEHDYLNAGWICPYCGHKERTMFLIPKSTKQTLYNDDCLKILKSIKDKRQKY